MEKAQAIVFVKYQGLTVEEDTMLRKELREAGVEYKVYKNTLSTIAAKNLGYESCVNLLEGPVSVAFGYDDVTAPARVLNDFAKKNKNLELKGGIIDGELYDVDKIKKSHQYHQKIFLSQNYLEVSKLQYQILHI